MERNKTHIFFPNLEILDFYNLTNLEKICHGPLIANSFGKVKAIKVKSCAQLEHLLLIQMVKSLSPLLEIEIFEWNSMKNIAFIVSMESDIIIYKIEFYLLRSLTLWHLPKVDDFYSNELEFPEPQNWLRTNILILLFNVKVCSFCFCNIPY